MTTIIIQRTYPQSVESHKIIELMRYGKITIIHQIYAFIAIWYG